MDSRSRQSVSLVLAAVLVIVLVALISAGCGDESTKSTSTSAASPSVTTATSSTDGSSTTNPSTTNPSTTNAPTTSSSTAGAATCSASQLDIELSPQAGLTAAVDEMRAKIFAAALSCDYEALESLALAGMDEFTYSFGGPDEGPAAYWRDAEDRGEPVLATLATILNMPWGREGVLVVWPYAYTLDFENLSSEEERLLAFYFTQEEIDQWKSFGAYLGYRVGMTGSGDWVFFVEGD